MTNLDLRIDVVEDVDAAASADWIDVCATSDIPLERGVAALVDGVPVALFALAAFNDEDVRWFAVDHIDPITGAAVMARGLVGSTVIDDVDVPTVASPIHKERYDLRTGKRLDGADPALAVWDIAVRDGRVAVRRRAVR